MNQKILYQHNHCHVTQPLLLEQLWEWGVDISAGQLSRINFLELLRAGQTDYVINEDALEYRELSSVVCFITASPKAWSLSVMMRVSSISSIMPFVGFMQSVPSIS